MKKLISLVICVGLGVGIGWYLPNPLQQGMDGSGEKFADEPLYWVAPMDPNFKRDQPGLSPMGMDLVPVYAEDLSGGSPGTVSINPEVVNNLGVKTEQVMFSPLQAQIEGVGYVEPDNAQQTDLHSRVSGWVESLDVAVEGEFVEQGQLLYTLYSPELVNAQEEYLAALSSGNRFLIRASREKLNALFVSETVLQQLKKQRKVQREVPVYAEQSGYVTYLNLRQGSFIKPAQLLLSIAPLDKVWVHVELPLQQAELLSVGDRAELRLQHRDDRRWQGQVEYVYPQVNAANRTLKLRLSFANPDLSLKPNMYVRAIVQAQPQAAVMHVPADAVIRTQNQNRVVLALEPGSYKSVAVALGNRVGDRIAIHTGVQPEDRVVTSAQFLLDSESSISSDFERYNKPQFGYVEEVWVQAEVTELDQAERVLTFRHGDIREWKQSAMLMQAPLDEALAVEQLADAKQVMLLLRGGDMNDLEIKDFILPRPKAPGSFVGEAP